MLLFFQNGHLICDVLAVFTQLFVRKMIQRLLLICNLTLATVLIFFNLLHFLFYLVENVLIVQLQILNLMHNLCQMHSLKDVFCQVDQFGVANLGSHLLQTHL